MTSYLIRKQQRIENDQLERQRLRDTRQSNQDSFLGITKSSMNKSQNLNKTKSSISNTSNLTSRDYLNSIYRSEDFVESYLNHKIAEITKSFDLRETIFSIFYRVGFNNISINSNDDRQTFVSI